MTALCHLLPLRAPSRRCPLRPIPSSTHAPPPPHAPTNCDTPPRAHTQYVAVQAIETHTPARPLHAARSPRASSLAREASYRRRSSIPSSNDTVPQAQGGAEGCETRWRKAPGGRRKRSSLGVLHVAQLQSESESASGTEARYGAAESEDMSVGVEHES
jgi:hypothetical protein